MSVIARQSTARIVTVGPILDADGVAVTTAVVGDLKIAKNGGAPASLNGSATLTHRNTGHYSLALTTSDTDTVGQAEIVIDKTTDAMPAKVITIVEEATYDALFAASATAFNVSGHINRVVLADTVTTLTGHTAQTGDSFARLGAPAGASHAADIAALKAETASILEDTGTTIPALFPAGFSTLVITGGLLDVNVEQINASADAAANLATVHAVAGFLTGELDGNVNGVDGGVSLADSEDVYVADIDLSVDEASGQEEYTVGWFKNGVPLSAGITLPLIRVVKRADGADLIASSAMTEIASTGRFKFDEGTARITAGEAVVLIVQATIDSSVRTFSRVLSRDSSA